MGLLPPYPRVTTDGKVTKMSASDSAEISGSIACESVNTDLARKILYQYFCENRNVIWEDAMVENRLLVA
jgi:hypothetical protein